MKPVTRRLALNMVAGAAAASTLRGSAAGTDLPDPALAAIARHRQASADHLLSIYAVDNTPPRTDARYDAEDHNEACCVAAWNAAWDLATTVPTTLAGVAAVLQYANEVEDQGDEWPDTDMSGPESWHYKLRQAMAAALVNLAGV